MYLQILVDGFVPTKMKFCNNGILSAIILGINDPTKIQVLTNTVAITGPQVLSNLNSKLKCLYSSFSLDCDSKNLSSNNLDAQNILNSNCE